MSDDGEGVVVLWIGAAVLACHLLSQGAARQSPLLLAVLVAMGTNESVVTTTTVVWVGWPGEETTKCSLVWFF